MTTKKFSEVAVGSQFVAGDNAFYKEGEKLTDTNQQGEAFEYNAIELETQDVWMFEADELVLELA